ncbi:MAG: HemK2/MTQ2 family protein methyltransferase [Candidatus Bathyarchaeia archaeon]|jgi:release factor glutamine methyltransferase
MHSPTKRIHFKKLIFDVNDDVYEPAEDSFLFAENLHVKAGEVVLDLGTGSGILAATAALTALNVLAVDINPYAIRCAKENARLNGVRAKIDFMQSDLFSALKDGVKFDLVLFNAPYLPSEAGEEMSWIGRSWAGGADGRLVVDRFISEVSAYLAPHGRVLLMQSTLTGVEETICAFKRQGIAASVVAEQKLPFFETLTLIEARADE